MPPIATNIEEALKFFLSHASGGILCQDATGQRICYCYEDARLFFERDCED